MLRGGLGHPHPLLRPGGEGEEEDGVCFVCSPPYCVCVCPPPYSRLLSFAHRTSVPATSIPSCSQWPKESVALSAAGGVGLFSVYHELEGPDPYHRASLKPYPTDEEEGEDGKGELACTNNPTHMHASRLVSLRPPCW